MWGGVVEQCRAALKNSGRDRLWDSDSGCGVGLEVGCRQDNMRLSRLGIADGSGHLVEAPHGAAIV